MVIINFTDFPGLTSQRLVFRQLVPGDEYEIFKLRSDERVNTYLTRVHCKTVYEARAFINKINKGIRDGEWIYWAITFKNDNKLIGTICLWNIQPEHYRAEIGYELHPDFWGRGIMKEAIPKIIDFGFETMNLHSLEADLDPGNLPSAALLERNGFVREGHFKEALFLMENFLTGWCIRY